MNTLAQAGAPEATVMFMLFVAVVPSILALIWALAITSRLADIRAEAKKHTELLRTIALQTAPATPPKLKESSVSYKIPGID